MFAPLVLCSSYCSHGQTFVPVNLDKIQHWINRGLLDPSRPITAKELYETRCIHSLKDGVKILGEGSTHLESPLNLIVSRASQTAISAIEAVGGSVECRYYTPLSLRALVKPHKFAGKILPRAADPIAKKDLGKFLTLRPKNVACVIGEQRTDKFGYLHCFGVMKQSGTLRLATEDIWLSAPL